MIRDSELNSRRAAQSVTYVRFPLTEEMMWKWHSLMQRSQTHYIPQSTTDSDVGDPGFMASTGNSSDRCDGLDIRKKRREWIPNTYHECVMVRGLVIAIVRITG